LPEQELDQFEIEVAKIFERSQLLEVVELSIEDIGLVRIGSDESLECDAQLFPRCEPTDELPRLHEGVFVPSAQEISCCLGFTGLPGLFDLPAGYHSRSDGTKESQSTD